MAIIDSDTIIETLAGKQLFLEQETMLKVVDTLQDAKIEKDVFLKWIETVDLSRAKSPVAYFMTSLRYFVKPPAKQPEKGQIKPFNIIGLYRIIENHGIERPTTREYVLTEEIVVDWITKRNVDPEELVKLCYTVCAYMRDKKLTRYESFIKLLGNSKFAKSIKFELGKINQKKVDEKAKAWDDLIDSIEVVRKR